MFKTFKQKFGNTGVFCHGEQTETHINQPKENP